MLLRGINLTDAAEEVTVQREMPAMLGTLLPKSVDNRIQAPDGLAEALDVLYLYNSLFCAKCSSAIPSKVAAISVKSLLRSSVRTSMWLPLIRYDWSG